MTSPVTTRAQRAAPAGSGTAPSPAAPATGPGRLLRGGSALAAAMLVANASNYLLNLYLARVMTPAEFADANLMVTFLFTLTAVALCLQMVAARFVARSDARGLGGDADALARRMRAGALVAGLVLAGLLAGLAPVWSTVFRTASPWPFVVLAVGLPFWMVQAVGRGVMQARLQLPHLAGSYLVEAATRLGLGVLLVALGLGVVGATAALTASFVVTSTVVARGARPRGGASGDPVAAREVAAYAGMVSILLAGQIIANNSDVLVSKAFFGAQDAASYAVVALVGRAVFFLSWSVVTIVFPEAARRQSTGQESTGVLRAGMAAVLVIGVVCAAGALWLGGPVLGVVLGPGYDGLAVPLAAYATVTTLFAVGNLVATYRLSQSRTTESWVLLAAAVLQVALMLLQHDDAMTLIAMQGVAMLSLLLALALLGPLRRSTTNVPTASRRPT